MKYYKFVIWDYLMIFTIPLILFGNDLFQYLGLPQLFYFIHYILFAMGYGGFITLGLFTSYQRYLADKKGLLSYLEDINKSEKRK